MLIPNWASGSIGKTSGGIVSDPQPKGVLRVP